MNIWEAALLGIFQGVTEFLPISSSGHLVLAETYFHLNAEELLAFDAVLHGGTLVSLFVVFWDEIRRFFEVIFSPRKANSADKNLLLWLIIATLPAGILGFLFEDILVFARTPMWVAIFFLVCAVLFFCAERFPLRKQEKMSFSGAMWAGVFQVFALFPGVSRSGVCTGAAMLMGVSRIQATRFAFLLGIPIIFAVFLLTVIRFFSGELEEFPALSSAMVGFFTSAISGVLTAKFLLRFFQEHSLRVFGGYLVVIGIGVLVMVYFG
jgi:undecaprenyl-diphosphatase